MADHQINNPSKLHIAMFPWLAFGHMLPFLEVAKNLSRKGHSISFISTPQNLERLPKQPPNSLITFIPFPLSSVPNLPASASATSDLQPHQIPLLKLAYDLLQQNLAQFLESRSPDYLFVDFVPYWAPPLASSLGIPTIFFSVFIASALVFFGPPGPFTGDGPDSETRTTIEDFTAKPRWVPFEDWDVTFRYFEIAKLFESLKDPNLSGVSDLYRYGMTVRGCCGIAPRGSYELEGRELDLLEVIYRKPVVPLGQLPPDTSVDREDSTTGTWRSVKEWLDGREKVVYMAFGSEATFAREELAELALGLELSGFPFFWVLRAQRDELPEGFEERTKNRGMIWTSWAPQLNILMHNSVVAMLTHSGWSSVVEAVSLGKPLLLFTLSADQGLNAKLLGAKQMAYVIPRDEKDGSFTKEAVAESLRIVVDKEQGKVYRDKVEEMSGLIGDKEIQNNYTNKLIDFLQRNKGSFEASLRVSE